MVISRFLLLGMLALTACTSAARVFAGPPTLATRTESLDDLINLPPPAHKLYVSVFAFQDQTGQHKPNDNYADYSFAVTQGGATILINALHDAGAGDWFGVLERNRLPDLLEERQIIRANRIEYPGPNGRPLPPLGPLLNAGVILEGGIVGYDSNLLTGGLGANFLGIGGSVSYRKDTVAVYMRAVSVLTGEVLTSVVANKTIYSAGVDGNINKFVGFNKLLQVETGFTTNEPAQLAVKQAIEKAVYATIMEGALDHYWSFADPSKQATLTAQYLRTRDGTVPQPKPVSAPATPARTS